MTLVQFRWLPMIFASGLATQTESMLRREEANNTPLQDVNTLDNPYEAGQEGWAENKSFDMPVAKHDADDAEPNAVTQAFAPSTSATKATLDQMDTEHVAHIAKVAYKGEGQSEYQDSGRSLREHSVLGAASRTDTHQGRVSVTATWDGRRHFPQIRKAPHGHGETRKQAMDSAEPVAQTYAEPDADGGKQTIFSAALPLADSSEEEAAALDQQHSAVPDACQDQDAQFCLERSNLDNFCVNHLVTCPRECHVACSTTVTTTTLA